jgi:hypothetical protein
MKRETYCVLRITYFVPLNKGGVEGCLRNTKYAIRITFYGGLDYGAKI